MSLRSALGTAQGQGAAHSGVHHWWMQRLTALALVPLSFWFVASIVALQRLSDPYQSLRAWIAQGWTAVLLILLVVAATWHSRLGVQVVLEDYIVDSGSRTLAIIVSNFAHIVLAVAGVVAILRVLFGVPF